MPDEQKGTGTDDPPTVGNPDDAANYCDSENAPIVAAATPAKEIGSASSLSPQPSENKAESCLFKHNNSCINCEETFSSGHAPVTEIKVGYIADNKDDEKVPNASIIFIVEALYSVFSADTDAIDGIDLTQVGLCLRCAEAAAQLYRHFIDLLNLSTPTSQISQLFEQFKKWHIQHPSSSAPSSPNVLTNGIIDDLIASPSTPIPPDAPKNLNSEDNTEDDAGEVTHKASTNETNQSLMARGNKEEKMETKKPVVLSAIRKSTRERKAKQQFDPDAEPDVVDTPPPTVSKSSGGGASAKASASKSNGGRTSGKRIKLEEKLEVVKVEKSPPSSAVTKRRKTLKSVLLPPSRGKKDNAQTPPSKAKASTTSTTKPSPQAPQSSRSLSKTKERTTNNSLSCRH